MNGKKLHLLIFAALISIMGYAQEVTIESLLRDMVDKDAIAKYPEHDFRLKQHSSYNRASVTPEETKGWFTNHDYNSSDNDHNFIRTEVNGDGETEWVLMDHQGPGAIVRTWMPFLNSNDPNTDIQMNIYLDGSTEPVMSGNMLGMFDGSENIPYPFAHKSLRSSVSFFPIPYATSCKVTTSARPFFFQFTFREYNEGTPIKTFTMEDFNAAETLIAETGNQLINPTNATTGQTVSFDESLDAQQEYSVALPEGNAAIKSIQIKIDDYNDILSRGVVLKIKFDDQQTVWCPIGDFFGSGIGLNPYQGWYRTVTEDGTMSARWVMPYQSSGEISIVNLSDKTINISLDAVVSDWTWDEQSMYFNAAWRGKYPVATRPMSDWNYVTLQGKGIYVGDALTIMNPVSTWWGEGDEKIWVDGEDFPSLFGTGTEDYYAYSWGGISNDFYEHPFHAQPMCHKYNKLNRVVTAHKNTMGYSTETRSRALDIMPFGSSLQLDMEIWSGTDCDMGYGVGVYWYGFSETTSNRTPDPDGVLPLPTLPDELKPIEVDTVPPVVSNFPVPRSYYDFEGDGEQVIDSELAKNHGAIIGSEASRVSGGIITKSGESSNCIELTGTGFGGSLSYIKVPYADFFSSSDYTISAWLKYTGTIVDYGYIFYQGGDVWPEVQSARSVDLWLNKSNSSVNSELYDNGGAKILTTSITPVNPYDGEWHLLGVSLENSTTLTIWIDGVKVATKEHTTNFKVNEVADLWIGARPHKNNTSVKFLGKMDRVRIFDYALSEDQMRLITFIEGPEGGSAKWPSNNTAGISDSEKNSDISIYPNPFSETLKIKCEKRIKEIRIYDVAGNVLHSSFPNLKNTTLHTREFSSGIFMIQLEFIDGTIITEKVIR